MKWLDKYQFPAQENNVKNGGRIAKDGIKSIGEKNNYPNGVIKQTPNRVQQFLSNLSGEWNEHKPQLMKDFPITDFSIGPFLDYASGKSDVPVFPVVAPSSLGSLKPSPKYFDKLVHYSNNPTLKYADIDLRRVGTSQMKKRYRSMPIEERPGGFYTTKNPKDVFMGGNQGYETYIPKTSRIKDLSAEGRITDRIPLRELDAWTNKGFDIIKGKNMIGKEEWIPLDKNKLVGWNKFTDNRQAFREGFENGGIIPKAKDGEAIKQREDFKGNWLRYQGSGGKRRDSYGELGDLYRYYAGDPLKYNALYKSEYKPTNSKDPNAEYISIKNKEFVDRIVEQGNRLFIDKNLNLPSIEQIELEKKGNHRNAAQWKDRIINENTFSVNDWQHPLTHSIGRYFVSKGKDNKGDYLSYYDVFDTDQPIEGTSLSEKIGATKSFEIYDRIHVNKDSQGKYTRRDTIPQIENSPVDKSKLKSWEGGYTFNNGGKLTNFTKPTANNWLSKYE